MTRRGWLVAVVLLGGCAAGFALWHVFNGDAGDGHSPLDAQGRDLVQRGAYLARAGNCAGCHTARGGAAYAGGRALDTPFGTLYSSNLTPDPQHGLGQWSGDDFWRALHLGISRDGHPLYPAFPYPSYTHIAREDADALFAWLRTLPPVAAAPPAHELHRPYDSRMLLRLWRLMYFRPGVFRSDARHDEQWNRGAYLVQGLGHCGACHTPRNALGASQAQAELAGGALLTSRWYAPALAGPSAQDEADMARLLKTGAGSRAAVAGPMAEVVALSLQHLDDADVGAMAHFLKSLPPSTSATPSENRGLGSHTEKQIDAMLAHGKALYGRHCADCHGEDGAGVPPDYPPLAGNAMLNLDTPDNAVLMVLQGGYAPGTAGNPRPYGMPPYAQTLGEDDIAAVVSYARQAWGNHAGLVDAWQVERIRGIARE